LDVIPFSKLIQFPEALGQISVTGAPDLGRHPQRLHIQALLKVLTTKHQQEERHLKQSNAL
jgi:hypothetical protein